MIRRPLIDQYVRLYERDYVGADLDSRQRFVASRRYELTREEQEALLSELNRIESEAAALARARKPRYQVELDEDRGYCIWDARESRYVTVCGPDFSRATAECKALNDRDR